jgi:HAD superfamily hydrolase (TIGR01509 family)
MSAPGPFGLVAEPPPARRSGIGAVLFDMDGTLVDSEKLWSLGLAELAIELGGELSADARAAMVGTNMATSMGILFADLGRPGGPADLTAGRRWLEGRMAELFATALPWQPGAAELLAEVRAAALPTALVTATRRSLVEVALITLGRHHFDVVVAGDEVRNSKPHPEPYATAAAALGVAAADCLAIEDSPTGLASALAAGCRVLVVPAEVPIAPGEGYAVRSSLSGLTVELLDAVAAGLTAGHAGPGLAVL